MRPEEALKIVGFSGIGFTMEQFKEANTVLNSALTELAEIKKVVENWDEGEYFTDSIHSMKKIEDILKGEKK